MSGTHHNRVMHHLKGDVVDQVFGDFLRRPSSILRSRFRMFRGLGDSYPVRHLRIRHPENTAQLLDLAARDLFEHLDLLGRGGAVDLAVIAQRIERDLVLPQRRRQSILELLEQAVAPPDPLPLAHLPPLLLGPQHQGRDVGGAGVAELEARVVGRQGRVQRLARVLQPHLRLRQVVVGLHVEGLQLDRVQAVRYHAVPCLLLHPRKGAVRVEGRARGIEDDASICLVSRRLEEGDGDEAILRLAVQRLGAFIIARLKPSTVQRFQRFAWGGSKRRLTYYPLP